MYQNNESTEENSSSECDFLSNDKGSLGGKIHLCIRLTNFVNRY